MPVCWANLRYLQRKRNGIEKDDDDVKFPLAHIKKMQNTAEVGTLASYGTALSTKGVVDR